MVDFFTDDEINVALDTCASEPVHTPGTIQPFGWLLACDAHTGKVFYASENLSDLLGISLEDVFRSEVPSLFGSEIWHGVHNISAQSEITDSRHFVGTFESILGKTGVYAFKSETYTILEIENVAPEGIAAEDLQEQDMLIRQIDACTYDSQLFDLTTRLMRHVSGFDRVMIYRFDSEWNGEVLAEAHSPGLETMRGLRFPNWDIPEQARALMTQIPLRVIADVDQVPVQLHACRAGMPALDITHAQSRGISPIHMQYLRNMGSSATMTLSVMLGQKLWGIISFHSLRPQVASLRTRQVLLGLLPIFRLKLDLLQREHALGLSSRIDALQGRVHKEMERDSDLNDVIQNVGAEICNALNANGIVMATGSQTIQYGSVPDNAVVDALLSSTGQQNESVFVTDCLSEMLPEAIGAHLKKSAGAVVMTYGEKRALLVFRDEAQLSVSWAGNPQKTIDRADGNLRLQPRGSFSTYLEQVRGRSESWTSAEIYLIERLWPLLSAAQRREFVRDVSRQQHLMINELNHRVRNILTLVKSVSQQTKNTTASHERYFEALEARINALSIAHDIGAGSANSEVSIFRIFNLEAEPHLQPGEERLSLNGPDHSVQAEAAPIFALVVHELMTNAVKYGALSSPEGRIMIDLRKIDSGIEIHWSETGGPPVRAPLTNGFGTTLITQAVPYELGGKAEVEYAESGLQARLQLPSSALGRSHGYPETETPTATENPEEAQEESMDGLILIVEDNFMIAEGMRAQIKAEGYTNIQTVATPENAMSMIEAQQPRCAILDINLGRGQTSEPIALDLLRRNIPFAFVTGYGEHHTLSPQVSNAPVMQKPAKREELIAMVRRMQA